MDQVITDKDQAVEARRTDEQMKGSPWYGGGAAFLSGLCCIVPLVAVLLGFGGVPFLLRLTTYRPHFIALSLVVMAGALWWTWRRNHNCCVSREQKRRLYVILASMGGAYLVVFLTLSLALPALINQYQASAIERAGGAGRNAAMNGAPLKHLDLTVEGMSCPTCPATVRSLLTGKPGVKDARFTYPDGRGYVLFDPVQITKERIIAILARGGYKAKITGEN